MIRSKTRTARKARSCDPCGRQIKPGERYRFSVASPGHEDLGHTSWWPLVECRECAERYGAPLDPQPVKEAV